MKKAYVLSLVLALLLLTALFTACTQEPTKIPDTEEHTPPYTQTEKIDETPLAIMENVTLDSETYVYDGTEKALSVKGAPEGAKISYTNATQTNAGTYPVQAVVTCDGYEPLTLNATLTIEKATISGISADPVQKVHADSSLHLPTFSGILPEGVTVSYMINGASVNGVSEAGTYTVALVLSGSNYEPLVLSVSLDVAETSLSIARRILSSFGNTPDVWSFLPESFSPEYHTLSAVPNYSGFVNVSSLPINGLGKQMNAVCGLLNKTEAALFYVDSVMSVLNTVESLYAAFLDTNPADASVYSGSVSAFTFTLSLEKDRYTLSASIGSVRVDIYSDINESTYGATIRLTDNTILKYTVSDNSLKIAMDVLDSVTVMMDLTRDNNNNATGMIYEYTSVGGHQLTSTSALITVNDQYTTIVGSKGDFIPTSEGCNCEVYDSKTGRLIISEVREDISDAKDKSKVFYTYWFPLGQLSGVTSIMKEDTANGLNLDTIYINGYTKDTLHTKIWVGTPLYKTGTRHFDIEFKTMYFFTYNQETGKYEDVKCEIPMLFVQREKLDSFENDFAGANKNALNKGSVSLAVSKSELQVNSSRNETLMLQYDLSKNAVTHQMIIDYCKLK